MVLTKEEQFLIEKVKLVPFKDMRAKVGWPAQLKMPENIPPLVDSWIGDKHHFRMDGLILLGFCMIIQNNKTLILKLTNEVYERLKTLAIKVPFEELCFEIPDLEEPDIVLLLEKGKKFVAEKSKITMNDAGPSWDRILDEEPDSELDPFEESTFDEIKKFNAENENESTTSSVDSGLSLAIDTSHSLCQLTPMSSASTRSTSTSSAHFYQNQSQSDLINSPVVSQRSSADEEEIPLETDEVHREIREETEDREQANRARDEYDYHFAYDDDYDEFIPPFTSTPKKTFCQAEMETEIRGRKSSERFSSEMEETVVPRKKYKYSCKKDRKILTRQPKRGKRIMGSDVTPVVLQANETGYISNEDEMGTPHQMEDQFDDHFQPHDYEYDAFNAAPPPEDFVAPIGNEEQPKEDNFVADIEKILMEKINENPENAYSSIFHPEITRKEAARFFYGTLTLAKNTWIEPPTQKEAFGDIIIMKNNNNYSL